MSPSDLAERAIHRRAVEAVVWGMPAVNCDLMYQAIVREAKGAFKPDRLLVATTGLEDPDADPES